MNVTPTTLPDVLLIEPRIVGDARGYFGETFRADRYEALGASGTFVQDNVSFTTRGVLRGLHFQHPKGQGKLLFAVHGEVFDVAVDVRVGSDTFGRWTSTVLSGANHRQLFIPPGFAHGFVVTSEDAIVVYKCSEYYAPGSERCVRWNDPGLGIDWPVADPILSAKDQSAPLLSEIPQEHLPRAG